MVLSHMRGRDSDAQPREQEVMLRKKAEPVNLHGILYGLGLYGNVWGAIGAYGSIYNGRLAELRAIASPVKMHAFIHTKCLHVNAWDAISAHDFARIDRRSRTAASRGERRRRPREMREAPSRVRMECLCANARTAIRARDSPSRTARALVARGLVQ